MSKVIICKNCGSQYEQTRLGLVSMGSASAANPMVPTFISSCELCGENDTTWIHNIWAGPLPGNILEHIDFCRQKFGERYQFWCFKDDYDQFQYCPLRFHDCIRFLDTSISDENLSPLGWLIETGEHELASVVSKLAAMEAYSAVKDILSIIILYLHGGIYLDTSVDITLCSVKALLDSVADGMPRFVARNDTRACEFLAFNFDVWLAYSPCGSQLFLEIINYLKDFWYDKRFGQTQADARKEFETIMLTSTRDQGRFRCPRRDETIGYGIINPIRMGLLKLHAVEPSYKKRLELFVNRSSLDNYKRHEAGNAALNYCRSYFWETTPTDTGRSVTELNMIKHHNNSWRGRDLSHLRARYQKHR